MIQNINIKNIATYDCFSGISVNELKKINFIYGANGSGKTTISNYLKEIENKQFSDCSIVWKNSIQLPTLVYNKKFREETFGGGSIPGVFTLGKATKEDLSEINVLNEELQRIKESRLEKESTLNNKKKEKFDLESIFFDQCWDKIYKNYEHLFKPAFKGFMGSRKAFAEKVLNEFKSNECILRTIEELKDRAKTLFNESPQIMGEIESINFRILIEIENNPIWNKRIIGGSDVEIGALIQHLEMNDWVNQGRLFLKDDSDVCPFCQKKTIDQDFRRKLEDYFNENYASDVEKVKELYDEYIAQSENALHRLQEIENSKNEKLENTSFSSYIKIIEQRFVVNYEKVNSKLKEPSRTVEIISIEEQANAINELIADANIRIGTNNALVKNFKTEKDNLISDIWRFIIEENVAMIRRFVGMDSDLKKSIDILDQKCGRLQENYALCSEKIKEKNRNITSVQSSIDEINKILGAYGFTNFKIVSFDERYYQVQRENGDFVENTLSEGEITFITFLYFMQLVKGGISPEDVNEEKVVIVDDPISSLDSTILFIVSSLLKELIKSIKKNDVKIRQIIILTHNVYFHKEVSFIDGRTKENNDTKYWILRKKNNITSIQCYEKKNPIRGSYELLWDELKDEKGLSGITLQNILRRIIETYFKTMGAYTDDALIDSFENPQKKEICRSLMCWINDGSHCISDDLHVEHQEVHNNIFLNVFKELFEKMGHIGHYNMMMGVEVNEEL